MPQTQPQTQPEFRTMWMFPRNIRRISPWKLHQIASILNAATGDTASQNVQDAMYDQLAKFGIKVERKKNGISNPGGMRTYFAQISCLGFFFEDDDGSWKPTIAGDDLLSASAPVQTLRRQLLRMQYPSFYGNNEKVLISPAMKVKPFCFLIRLLRDQRLEGYLTSKDMAVAVVYGRTNNDLEVCVQKILKLREPSSKFKDILDSPDDLKTPIRWDYEKEGLEQFLKTRINDAESIGNTAKNYLEAAQVIFPSGPGRRRYKLTDDPAVLAEINALMAEKIEPAPEEGHYAAWQRRYGRGSKTKDTRSLSGKKQINGRTALLRTRLVSAVEESPYGFNLAQHCAQEAQTWGMPEADIYAAISPMIPRMPSVERDTVMAAAISGGAKSGLLEKAITAVFRRLGFELSEHIGQKKTSEDRDGGYPDIRIRSGILNTCGFGDTKATVSYGFPLGDTQKLATYYRDCDKEFPDQTPSAYFLYIAGGFGSGAQRINAKLQECAQKYGRPVSAVTVSALLDLAEKKDGERPAVQALDLAFKKGQYYTSAEMLSA